MSSTQTSNVWCPLPWVHQFIQTNGIKTCCQGTIVESTSPLKFFDTELVSSVRQSILNNQWHDNCIMCKNLEQKGFSSTRTESVKQYNNLNNKNIKSQVEYLDLRYSNLCNFSCRTCEPTFSTSIVNEINQHLDLKKFYAIGNKANSFNSISEDLNDILPTVKKINFTGGEPLLIKDNLEILSKLIELGNTNCEILITTNASVINPKWASLLPKFSSVHWTISLDGIGPYAEYIRYGSQWQQIEENINYILSLNHSVSFNTVLSAYSVLDIDRLVEFFKKCKDTAVGPLEHMFRICSWPKHLSPGVLTDKLSQIARNKITNAVKLLSTIDDNPASSIETLKNTLTILNTSDIRAQQKFIEFTKALDYVRNQNFYNLIEGEE